MRTGPFRLENVSQVVKNPRAAVGAIQYLAERANIAYFNAVDTSDGCDIVNEDWDNLVLLDGCRYDTFRDVNWISGTLEKRTSRGSESLEFLLNNFHGKELHDIVYVTTNPYVSRLPAETFHAVVNLLKTAWDPNLNTVPPAPVVSAAQDALERYPNKRLIVHFIQPHFPFIGEFGQEIDDSGFSPEGVKDNSNTPPWRRLRFADQTISEEEVRQAYRENLRLVLNKVENLLTELNGRTVISSDHGNLIGDCLWPIPTRGYGHPRGLHVPELITVPWLIHEDGPRRETVKDTPVGSKNLSEETVENRLDALGYR